jgi:hypothetical protein
MFAIGAVVLATVLGGFCGLWVPLVLFLSIVVLAAAGSALSMAAAGLGVPEIELQLLAVITLLEAGYLGGLLARSGMARPSNPDWKAAKTAVSETSNP